MERPLRLGGVFDRRGQEEPVGLFALAARSFKQTAQDPVIS